MNNQRWMSQNFFAFYMTWGIFLPYWTGFLVEAKGLTISQASLIMSCSLAIRGISTLFAFPYIARKWSSKRVLDLFAILSLLIMLLFIPASSFSSLLVVTLLFSFFFPALMPALDSVAGILLQHGQLHYGQSRSYGSLGFVVMVFIASVITGQFGDMAILWLLLGGLILLVLLNTRPAPAVLLEKPKGASANKFSVKKLLQAPNFLIVLIIAILLQGAHASYYNYGYIYLQELGVAKYYIGLIINIGVFFEILFFAKSDRLFGHWKPANLLLVAAIGSTLRWLMVSLVPTIPIFIVSQSLHAVSFALAHFAVILFFTQNLQKEQIPNAQGMYNAFAMGWSTAILTLFGGFLYEMEPRLAFLGMTVCTVPALFLALYLRKKA
ncbi:3-phenylpropionate MFS transporter [Metasolibacillus meyeri]|uniref:3-phenylpropionate MFS transporter n=1 Tax=Metasolibacillus meyeri TaxID=1071052 RepID=A0AAW9NSC3_9BACL|nr:3-phenylpropionate MFS transporter [Metasolibacillus meyeri]MEC1177083.1 3-phenylpropionate MFS transporter [Metasolibacillus meyeri]